MKEMKKKKLVFNNKGMMIYFLLAFIAIICGAVDSTNITIFIITKIIAVAIMIILLILSKFIPKKYIED